MKQELGQSFLSAGGDLNQSIEARGGQPRVKMRLHSADDAAGHLVRVFGFFCRSPPPVLRHFHGKMQEKLNCNVEQSTHFVVDDRKGLFPCFERDLPRSESANDATFRLL